MKKFITIFSISMLLSNLIVKAAVTVDTSLVADNVEYKLLINIPDDYDAAQQYPLVICLQPCNNAPVEDFSNGLKPITDSLKMIVATPGVLKYSNGWLGDAQWGIITASIDSAIALYNIDTTSIYLNGMSCNGYYSLRQGAKKMYPFKGIFPYAPYMSSVNPGEVNLNTDMPITIAVGTKDEYSYNPILNLYDSLKNHGAKVNLVLIPGITHTFYFPDFGNEMIHSLLYLNDTNSISIEYSGSPLSDMNIMDNDGEQELVFKVYNEENKELTLKSLSSNIALIPDPDITYSPADSTVTLRFTPQSGKAGKAILVLEAHEQGGTAMEQLTFKVNVTKHVVGVNDYNQSGSFGIYPNPVTDNLTIQTTQTGNFVEIIDLTGKVLFSDRMQSNTISIDVKNYKKGIYFIQLRGTDFCETRKVIIQ